MQTLSPGMGESHHRKLALRVRRFVRRSYNLLSGTLKRIPVSCITNEFGFAFGPSGWNYFRALITEYDREPAIAFENTTFYKFFQDNRVKSVRYLNDLLFLHDPERRFRHDYKFYFGTYPWGDHVGGGPWGYHYDCVEGKFTRDVYGYRRNPWYQPGDNHPLEIEWAHTKRIYEEIRKGYAPLRFGEFPQVTLLVRRNGDLRAIRYNGQHRLAALSHLGYKKLMVAIPSLTSIANELDSWPTTSEIPKLVDQREIIVREEQVDDWYYVKHGYCSREQALEIFTAFFDLNGRERVEYLSLPSIY